MISSSPSCSPVVKYDSRRAVLAIATSKGIETAQFDVKPAFLIGDLQEVIYTEQPESFSDSTRKVCRLLKSLYGLKQSARCWNETFTYCLDRFKLKPIEADPYVFISHE